MNRRLVFVSLLALPLALFAACGGDGDPATPTATATGTSSATSASPTASGSSGDALAAIKDLSAKLDRATFRANYDVKSDAAAGNLSGTLKLAAQPPAKVFDYRGKTPLGTGAYIILQNSDGSFLCLEVQGSKNCARSSTGSGSPGVGLPAGLSVQSIISEVVKDPSSRATELAGRTVAGQQGHCFQVDGSSTTGTLCLTSEGVPLVVDGRFQGAQWTITATAVGAPVASDFEAPFPIAA